MKRPLLFSLCIILLLSISAASMAASIGEGPVELDPDEFVSITPVNSSETYQVPETTVLGALDKASRLGGFEYQVAEDLPADQGNLSVIAIADLEGNLIENEIVDDVQNNWTYWVNDVMGTTGAALETVADGDVLAYTYGPPSHTIEDASYALMVFVSVIPTEVPEETPTETPEETSAVNVTIISPEEGASIPAGNVTVEVDLTDFTLVEPTGQPNAPGEGHLHYYLDAPIPTNESEPAIPETGGYAISTNLSYT
ncbi:MAG: DUF4430 domain-containing protein, partial [Methanomicrobiales archaeon]|nr:DUF4430 domain-containing protein [Methanomicrobiales archaeon]